MKIDIIIVYMPRYRWGHEMNFVPPLTGIHLAALTPPQHRVRVFHQQVDSLPMPSDADLIAISFFSGFAPEAFSLAKKYKSMGKYLVAGGPHVTFSTDEALQHFDTIITGEAENVWKNFLDDFEAGQPQRVYEGKPCDLAGQPMPRYDLLSPSFVIQRVVQATRGCPFSCSFCSVPAMNPGFRTRPVNEVIRDIQYNQFPFWWQKKVVWFWDDNLTANRVYVKKLLKAMIPLKKWWLTQASLDIAHDPELLDLMCASGCIGIFLGIETFENASLKDACKRQNRVETYRECIQTLHNRGIAVMAGFISGFDGDTPESIIAMADHMLEVGVDVPFLSVLTPYKGTPLYAKLKTEKRLLENRGWEFFNGYNASFLPASMSPKQLITAHRQLWRLAFSPIHILKRIGRSFFQLRPGALLLTMAMNGFYGIKALRGNLPRDLAAPE
jgi:radical SAM superfamily enzyme YgiQ (UPF0313 family)